MGRVWMEDDDYEEPREWPWVAAVVLGEVLIFILLVRIFRWY
jgi:hypothetical protein